MLTPLRPIPFRTALLSLALAAASLTAFPAPVHAGPCDTSPGGGLGCFAEGENPGNPGNPGGPNNNGGPGGNNTGPNNGPGNGPGQVNNGGIEDEDPDPLPAAVPNTEDTLAQAFNQIEFPVPTIEVEPEPKTYVRVKTSFWIPAEQAEEISVSATVGAAEGVQEQTVTATAKFKHVLWDLVEDEMICEGPGRPNGEGDGEECDYHFKTSSAYHGMDAFEITATPYWEVTWTCEGVCPDGGDGPEPEVLDAEYASPAGEIDLVVDEIQAEANKN